MNLTELQEQYKEKQNDIVSKRKQGIFASQEKDTKFQKDVWEWYKEEEFKITGDPSKILSEAKGIVEGDFDIARKSAFWTKKTSEKDLYKKALTLFEEFEERLSMINLEPTTEDFKKPFINEAIEEIKKFSSDKDSEFLQNNDYTLCDVLAKIVRSYYKELGI